MTFDRWLLPCVTVQYTRVLTAHDTPLTIPHHLLRMRADQMGGMRIVEHDDDKGCKTTFQFKTPLEKSVQEVGTEVCCLTVPDRRAQPPFHSRLWWKSTQMLRIRMRSSSNFYQTCSYLLGTPTAFLPVGVLRYSRFAVSADPFSRLPTVGSCVSSYDNRR